MAVVGGEQENKNRWRPMKHREASAIKKKTHLSSRGEWYSRRTGKHSSRSFFLQGFRSNNGETIDQENLINMNPKKPR